MHEGYLELNHVPTKISTWGKWIEESSQDSEDIVILVTGNPGINGFYDIFAKTIHDKLGYPVWCIGHAGHDLPEDPISIPKFKTNSELYGMKGQIKQKADFFEKYIPNDARIHLVGHSVGSYIILELLDHPCLKDKVCDVHFLFPTIEHMADTSNGKFLTRYVKPIVSLTVFLSWIFTLLPNILQNTLLYAYMIITGMPYLHLNNIKALVKPGVLRRVFFMAFDEMNQVKKRNDEVIKKNITKIKFLYGANDGWAPNSFCDRIKLEIPNVNAQVSNYDHTFVLTQSVEVANIVLDWIKAKQ